MKVLQNGRSYVARKHQLNQRTIAVFEIAINLGFSAAIQNGHPKAADETDLDAEAAYLSLGRSYDERWDLVIDDLKTDGYNKLLIQKRHQSLFDSTNVQYEEQWRSPKNLEIQFNQLQKALTVIIESDGL